MSNMIVAWLHNIRSSALNMRAEMLSFGSERSTPIVLQRRSVVLTARVALGITRRQVRPLAAASSGLDGADPNLRMPVRSDASAHSPFADASAAVRLPLPNHSGRAAG